MITLRVVCGANINLGANKKVYPLKAGEPQDIEFKDKAEFNELKKVVPGLTEVPSPQPTVTLNPPPVTPIPQPPPIPTIPPAPPGPTEPDDAQESRLPGVEEDEKKPLTGLKSLKKAELVKLCKDKQVDSKGSKPELIARLEALTL